MRKKPLLARSCKLRPLLPCMSLEECATCLKVRKEWRDGEVGNGKEGKRGRTI